MQKYKIFGTKSESLVWGEDDLAEAKEESDTVLKLDFFSQLVTLLLPTLHMGSKPVLNSSGSVVLKQKFKC